MDDSRRLGELLNDLPDASERSLVGHALAIATSFVDETGCTAEQLQEIISHSRHEIPPKIAGRLSDLRSKGWATPRGGRPQKWKLTPAGIAKFDSVTKGMAEIPQHHRFLQVDGLPDSFYEEVVRQINRAYQVDLYSVVLVWARKLLENLVIDLLRKRYTMSQATIWFDPARGRFRDFSALSEALAYRLGDFKAVSASFDDSFISKLEQFRESGNSRAHSIEVLTSKADVDRLRDDLGWLVRILSRALGQLK